MKIRSVLKKPSQLIFFLAIVSALIACGGADVGVGGDDDDGEIIIVGTAAEGAPIQNALVEIKSQNGVVFQLTTNELGEFSSGSIAESGPFITRVVDPSGGFLHSLAFPDGSRSINNNIHPLSDLIVRNWAAQQGIELDTLFTDDIAIVGLPAEATVVAVELAISNIIQFALLEFDSDQSFDLFSTPFAADGTGFDGFLDFTQVFISNDRVTVTITDPDPESQVMTNIIEDLPLDNNFLAPANAPPSTPERVRAVIASAEVGAGEVIVVWDPSTDDEGVAGYNVFRNGEFIDTTPYPVYIDEGLTLGQSLIYAVEAVDGRGAISGLSEETVEIFLNEPDTTPPASAEDLQIVQVDLALELTWVQQNIDDVFGFRISRNDDPDFALVTGTRFVDRDVIDGETYCYQVISFDASDNFAEPSQQVCAVFGGADAPSQVNLVSQAISVSEGAGSLAVGVQRFGNRDEEITVGYRIIPVTAEAGIDFLAEDGMLTWQSNESGIQSFDIQLLTDFNLEQSETLTVELFDPSSNTMIGSISETTITIENNPFSCSELTSGDLSNSVTLNDTCYTVAESLTVANNVELTVSPGVALVFADGAGLTIAQDGLLTAVGTAENKILFTAANPVPGSWTGIDVSSSSISQLEHFIVEYGGFSSQANIQLSDSGQLSIGNGIVRFASGHGLVKTESQTLINFSNIQFMGNGAAPVSIDANSLDVLDASSSFSGNEQITGVNFDFILVTTTTDITENQRWRLLDVPYRFEAERYDLNASVRIDPGVELQFGELSVLAVNSLGEMQAIGSTSSPIIFTGVEKEPGFWGKLIFNFSNNDNILNNVIIENGGGTTPTGSSTNLFVVGDTARLDLQNVTIRESAEFGISLLNQPSITGSNLTITQNRYVGFINDVASLALFDISGSFTGNTEDEIRITSTSIDNNLNLTNVGVIYEFLVGQLVSVNASLEIAAGVEVHFRNSGGFLIEPGGSLAAIGTPQSPIVFGASDPLTVVWDGVLFSSSNSPNNQLSNVILEDGGRTDGTINGLLSFLTGSGSPSAAVVEDVLIRNSDTNGVVISSDAMVDLTGNVTFENIAGQNILTLP